jgi:CDP-paratose 2-epimerase
MGGSRHSNCSILEAIEMAQSLSGRQLQTEYTPKARIGDHIWWVSDVRKFQADYPEWKYKYGIKETLAEIVEAYSERLGRAAKKVA